MVEMVKKFDNLFKKLASDYFLKKDGLGGEIPFFISPYNAEQELQVSESIQLLKKKLDIGGYVLLEVKNKSLVTYRNIYTKRSFLTGLFISKW